MQSNILIDRKKPYCIKQCINRNKFSSQTGFPSKTETKENRYVIQQVYSETASINIL